MSITENLGLDALGLPLDSGAVLQRVLQRVAGRMMSEGMFSTDTGSSPEEVISTAIGNWLTQALRPDQPALAAAVVREDTPGDVNVDDLADRNSALAAALGACDCWGDDPACPWCDGYGTAGWLPPDRRLFATYVAPALRSLKVGHEVHHHARAARTNHQQKGHTT